MPSDEVLILDLAWFCIAFLFVFDASFSLILVFLVEGDMISFHSFRL